ncbi:MAG: PGPGW domain-containing protein [Nitriliruptor sp.]
MLRLLKAGFGVLLTVAGVAMLVLPGPGLLVIGAGVALTLSQWPAGRRLLARVRLRMRERFGSPRVRKVESRIPDTVCPPDQTAQLRALAEMPTPPPARAAEPG